nr:unnamed protein product [Callosobruchus chinensis]
MAEKIRESNKEVMKLAAQTALQRAALHKILSSKPQKVAPAVQEQSEDYASAQGQFGWTTIADKNVPYLIRSGDRRYVCKRMLDQQIFNKYLQVFTEEYIPVIMSKLLELPKQNRHYSMRSI